MEQGYEINLSDYKRAVSTQTDIQPLYIPIQGKLTTNSEEEPFDLAEKILSFFVFNEASTNDPKVMLLMGDTGSGKSVFSQQLHQQLWRDYKTGDPIPLWISLPELGNPFEGAVEGVLKKYKCTASQIAEMKAKERFIFIVDGYDELHQFQNCYVTNKWNQWNAKVLITCRSQALYYQKDPDKYFMPFNGEKRLPMLLQKLYVAPFSKDQISAYVKKYQQLNTENKILEEDFAKIPGLVELINKPFLLHLAVEALPDILANQVNNEKMTQAKLYDIFIERWFTRQVEKLSAAGLLKETEKTTKQQFWDYCKRLAQSMHEKEVSVIPYLGQKVSGRLFGKQEKANVWQSFFNEQSEILRSACPLKRFGENHYGFVHASMIEYFATRAMYENIQQNELEEIQAVVEDKEKVKKEDEPASTREDDQFKSGIHYRVFSQERNTIQFLADRIEMSEAFKQKMLGILEASKKSLRFSNGAANAITALVRAGVTFNGANLSGIKISGADISGGFFDRADMSEADLSNSQMHHVWLRGVNLEKSHLAEINFGEYLWYKHKGEVINFDYRENLNVLVTFIHRRGLVLWDIKTGIQLDESRASCEIPSLEFSPDGERLILAVEDAIVVKVKTKRNLKSFNILKEDSRLKTCSRLVKEKKVLDLKFSRNGQLIVSGSGSPATKIGCPESAKETVRVWDVESGKKIMGLQHGSYVYCVAISPDGLHVVGCGDYGTCIWKIETGKMLTKFEGHEGIVNSVQFSPDGHQVVSGGNDKTVQIWEMETGKQIKVLQGHNDIIRSVDFSPDGTRVISGSNDYTVRIWDLSSGKVISVLWGHEQVVNKVQFTRDGQRVVSGSSDKIVRLWDITSGSSPARLSGHNTRVTCIAISQNGKQAVSGSDDKTVRIWNMESGKESGVFQGHEFSVYCVAFNVTGEWVISGDSGKKSWENDTTLRVWEVTSGKELFILRGHKKSIISVAFSTDGKRILSGDNFDTVHIWDVKNGHELAVIQLNSSGRSHSYIRENSIFKGIPFSKDGTQVLYKGCGVDDSQVKLRVWDLIRKEDVVAIKAEEAWMHSMQMSPDGKLVAAGSGGDYLKFDYLIRVWNVSNSNLIAQLQGHEAWVISITFNKNSNLVISGSNDQTIRIWAITSAQCLSVLKLRPKLSAFSYLDNSSLIVGFEDGRLEYWQNSGNEYDYCWTLQWTTDLDSRTLYVQGLQVTNAIGLSGQNRYMLEQRGAIVTEEIEPNALTRSSELITQVARRSGSPLHESLDENDHASSKEIEENRYDGMN